MTKQSGLGDQLYLSGMNLSGDVGSIDKIASPLALLDVTGIDKSAYERIGGHRDGGIDFTAFFNTVAAAEHLTLSPLPTTDIQVMYLRGQAIGSPGACMVAKQVNYDPTRGADGSLTEKVSCIANGYGLEWGDQLTAGQRTDTTATNGASLDGAASTSFGWQAYLQAFALTGTSCTVTVQDSADNASWANLSGAAFAAFTAAATQRLVAASATATVRRYLRVITSGTFTSATFAVVFVRNQNASVVF